MSARPWVLFGGAGFVGRHLAQHLLASQSAPLVIADIALPPAAQRPAWYAEALSAGRLVEAPVDIRQRIDHPALAGGAEVAIHLAAVHREPGHEPHEYFETNVTGAEQIAAWAAAQATTRVLFVSSISVYGDTRGGVEEGSLPMPQNPYGISKLLAEKILERWAAADPRRRLAIVRPAVVFGAGEGGNVSRLVRAVLRRRFAYSGNQDVRKAGGYVKELCDVIAWLVARMDAQDSVPVVNFGLPQAPTLAQYVAAIQQVDGRRAPMPHVPYPILHAAAVVVAAGARLLGLRTAIHPRRVEKLKWPTDVRAAYLVKHGYPFRYTLESALADWKREQPEEWAR